MVRTTSSCNICTRGRAHHFGRTVSAIVSPLQDDLDGSPTPGAPSAVISELRQQYLDDIAEQELGGEEERAAVGGVCTSIRELWCPTLMDDGVPRFTEFYEPVLQVRDECGLSVTTLISPGSSVNGPLLRRPHQDLGILPRCVWQRLEGLSELAGTLPVGTRAC